ncbi:MAG: ABC transporter ATP-binding protein [Caldilineaceae bacterium]
MNQSLQIYQLRPFSAAKAKRSQLDSHFRFGLRLVQRILVGQAWVLMLAFLLLFVKALLALIELYPLAYLIDYLTGYRPDLVNLLNLPAWASPLIMTAAALTTALVFLTLLHSLIETLAEVCLTRCGHMLSYKLRFRIFTHLNQFPHTPHHQRQVDDILTRFINDVSLLEDFLINSSAGIVGNFFLLVGTLLFLGYYAWEMAVLGIGIIGVTALLSRHFTQYIQATFQQRRAYEDDLVSATQELLTPILALQPYNNLNHEQQRFAESNHQNFKANQRAATLQAQFGGWSKVVEALTIVALLWAGLWLFNQTNLSIGLVLLLTVLSYNLIKPTRKFIEGWVAIQQVRTSIERIGELLNQDINFANPPLTKAEAPVRAFLETPVDALPSDLAEDFVETLLLPAEPEGEQAAPFATGSDIQHLNLAVHPGEVLALCNAPQTDSNMITELLVNLTATPDGQLWIGRQAEGAFSAVALPQLHIMLREPVLFNGSVADNIAQGRAEVTREQIVKAAQQANAHHFIETWPAGYDTLLNPAEATITADQRQCIAIARAILQDAPVLMLDEPTLLLEARTAGWVRAALRILMQGRTTIMLSHDSALLSLASRIVQLREGKVEEIEVKQLAAVTAAPNMPTQKQMMVKESDHESLAPPTPLPTLSLVQNLSFQQRLPGLATALNAETMCNQLQTVLIGAARSQQYTITRCTPGEATYQQGECTLQYELEILDRASGKTLLHCVLGRLFTTPRAAENYFRQRLAPLTTQIVGHPENLIFGKPCAQLEMINMVVHVFPIDGELPMLITLTQGERMIEFFQRTLPEAANRRFLIQECTIRVLHYEPHRGCLLRYQLDGRLANAHKAGREILFGQVTADDSGELLAPVLLGLRRWMQENNMVYRFNLPQLLSYHPDVRLALFETLPGAPLLPQLLKNHLLGAGHERLEGLTLEAALEASARIASTLHTAGVILGRPYTLEDELAALQSKIEAANDFSPALAKRLNIGLNRIQAYAEKSEPLPLCFTHGAFTPWKPLFERTSSGLLDWESICQAEPARDLGQFQAHLRLLMLEIQSEAAANVQAAQLCTHFLQTYMVELGYTMHRAEQLHVRVQIYEAVQLIALILQKWQTFAERSLEQLITIFEERLAALPQLQHQETVRKTSLYWLNGSHVRK